MNKFIKCDLQLFNDGSATSTTDVNTGSNGDDTNAQVSDTNNQPATDDQSSAEDLNNAFMEMINGKYKEPYEQNLKMHMSKRMKNTNKKVEELEAFKSSMQPLFDNLSLKYGLKSNDVEGILSAVTGDTSYLKDYAIQNGVTEDVAKRLIEAEKMANDKAQQEAEIKNRQEFDKFYKDLERQGEALKAVFPGFNLEIAMQNPQFSDRIFNGYSVEDAYKNAYFDDIVQGGMQYVYNRAKQEQSLKDTKKQNRPNENLSNSQMSQGATLDYEAVTPQQRAKINDAIRRGEKVDSSNYFSIINS